MANVHDKERTLQREIAGRVESALPDVEVLAVELAGPERFTVFIDRVGGASTTRSASASRTSSATTCATTRSTSPRPGSSARSASPQHFRNVVGRRVTLRTESSKRLRGEVVDAGERAVTLQTDNEAVQVPYERDPAREPDRREVSG